MHHHYLIFYFVHCLSYTESVCCMKQSLEHVKCFVDKGTVLVAALRGANSPLLLKTIGIELAKEHAVLEGKAERVEVLFTLQVTTLIHTCGTVTAAYRISRYCIAITYFMLKC
jgi:hypothetical protein